MVKRRPAPKGRGDRTCDDLIPGDQKFQISKYPKYNNAKFINWQRQKIYLASALLYVVRKGL